MRDSNSAIFVKIPFNSLFDMADETSGNNTSFISPDGKIYKFINGKFVANDEIEEFSFKQHSDDDYGEYFEVPTELSGELPKDSVLMGHFNKSKLYQLFGEADVSFNHKPTKDEISKMSERLSKVISACMTLYGKNCFAQNRMESQDDKFKNIFQIYSESKNMYKAESEYFAKRFLDIYLPDVKRIKPTAIVEKEFAEFGNNENSEFKLVRAYKDGVANILYSLPEFYINPNAEKSYHDQLSIAKACFYEKFGDRQAARDLKKMHIENISGECVIDFVTKKEKGNSQNKSDYISGERLNIFYNAKVSSIKQKFVMFSEIEYEPVAISPEFISDAIKAGVMLFGKSFLNKSESEQREAFINSYVSSYNRNNPLFEKDLSVPQETFHIDLRSLNIVKVLSTEFVQKVLPESAIEKYAHLTPENLVDENDLQSEFASPNEFFARQYGLTSEMEEGKKLDFTKFQLGGE